MRDKNGKSHNKDILYLLQEVHKRFPDGVPLLDPVEDLCIKDERLKSIVRKIEAFEKRMYKHPLHTREDSQEIYKLCERKMKVSIDSAVGAPRLGKFFNVFLGSWRLM